MRKMRLFTVEILFFFCISLFPELLTGDCIASGDSGSDTKDKQVKQIESDLSREKEKYQKYKFEEKDLLEQLSGIEKDITEKRVILNEIREKISKRKKELNGRREHLKQLEKSLGEMEELLGKRLTAFYKYAKRGYTKVLATARDLDQLNHRIKYLRIILDEDRKAMNLVSDKMKNYRQEVSLIEEQVSAIKDLEEDESSRLASLNNDLEKKVIFLAKIHQEKKFHETAVKELESAAESLKGALNRLDKANAQEGELPADFAEKKGKLPLPFDGEILSESERPEENSFFTHKGIYIRAPFGSDVRAVFPGRVDFSGQLKGYGQVIVINHGSRFFTVSAYLLQRNKSEGEMVTSREVIGKVGEAGLVSGPALYFEVRKGESSLNPLKWLEIKS